jgi:hypothetical protein
MSSNRITFPALALLGFSAAAGVGWNWGDAPSPSSAASVAPSSPERDNRPLRRVRLSSGPRGEAAQRLERVRNARTPEERMRATVDLANSLPPSEFAAWMDGGWFNLRDGPGLTLISKIIAERWKNEDPEGLVAWCLKNKSGEASAIFAEWAQTDPRRVLDFFKAHSDDRAELQALGHIAKTNPSLALQRLQELASGLSLNELGFASGLIEVLAKQSPAALEAALESLPKPLKSQAEVQIIGQRLRDSFDTEFEKLTARADGSKILQAILNQGDREVLQGKIFENLAKLPASWHHSIASSSYQFISESTAPRWVGADLEGMGFSSTQAENIRSQALSRMAYRQPDLTLKLLGQSELSENVRKNVIQNVFRSLRDKPEKAEALLTQLASDEERQTARSSMESIRYEQVAKIDKPAEWLEAVAALDPKPGAAYQYVEMIRNWDQEKLTVLSDQFKSMPDDSKTILANLIASSSLHGINGPLAGDAIRYLIQNPAADLSEATEDPFGPRGGNPAHNSIRLASNYVQSIAQNDPAAASEWIHSLPAGEPKLWAQKNLHSLWSQYDPKAADQWMKSLPAASQTQLKGLGKGPGH